MCSGLKAVHLATQAIAAGDAEIVVAGGLKIYEPSAIFIKNSTRRFPYGDQKVIDSMITDGLWCAFNDYHMGITAENLNSHYHITREEQDTFARCKLVHKRR